MAEDNKAKGDDDEHNDKEDNTDKGPPQGAPEGGKVIYEREVLEN